MIDTNLTKGQIILILFAILLTALWLPSAYHKASEDTYEKEFKDKRFNLTSFVTMPSQELGFKFKEYQKQTYNANWIDISGLNKNKTTLMLGSYGDLSDPAISTRHNLSMFKVYMLMDYFNQGRG